MTFAISLIYELWRVIAKSTVSRHDTRRAFWQEAWLYVLAAVVIVLLFARSALSPPGSAWSSRSPSSSLSIFYYNPKIMIERKPGVIDWVEDLVYTGLLFVVAALLTLEVSGLTLA